MNNFLVETNRLFKKIETTYKVNELYIDEIRIWPLIRFILFEKISRHKKLSTKQKLYQKYYDLKYTEKITDSSNKFENIIDINEKNDLIFITDDHFYVNFNGKYHNKYLDPIIENIKYDFEFKKLHLYSKISNDKFIPSYKILDHEDICDIKIEPEIINFFESIKLEFKNTIFKNVDLSNLKEVLIGKFRDINYGKMFIQSLKHKPLSIFYCSYTTPFKLGINIQAKKSGIHTVDVQHGKQGKNQPLYTNWNTVPSNKYEMLPEIFWNWNDLSKNRIELLENNVPSGLKSVVSGYQIPKSLIKKLKFSNTILVTLQPLNFQNISYLQKFLKDFIKKDKKYSWIIKPHPKQNLIEVKKIRRELNFKNVTIDTEKNIFELLSISFLHITEYSSVAYESLAYGIPTIFTNKIALDEFEDELRKGLFTYCENIIDLEKSIVTLKNSSPKKTAEINMSKNYLKLEPLNYIKKL